jgi:hypothetical protein
MRDLGPAVCTLRFQPPRFPLIPYPSPSPAPQTARSGTRPSSRSAATRPRTSSRSSKLSWSRSPASPLPPLPCLRACLTRLHRSLATFHVQQGCGPRFGSAAAAYPDPTKCRPPILVVVNRRRRRRHFHSGRRACLAGPDHRPRGRAGAKPEPDSRRAGPAAKGFTGSDAGGIASCSRISYDDKRGH